MMGKARRREGVQTRNLADSFIYDKNKVFSKQEVQTVFNFSVRLVIN